MRCIVFLALVVVCLVSCDSGGPDFSVAGNTDTDTDTDTDEIFEVIEDIAEMQRKIIRRITDEIRKG